MKIKVVKSLMASHCLSCSLWFDNKTSDPYLKCSECKSELDHYINGVEIGRFVRAEQERCRRVVADHSIKIRDAVMTAYLDAPMIVGRMLSAMQKDIYGP